MTPEDLIADAVTHDLVRIKDEAQALRLALLATLVLTQEGELPEALREYLTCHFSPLVRCFTDHRAPFTEDYSILRSRDGEGNYRLLLSEDFLRSLVSH
jgi:hypothetical protein